jgi:hypothetical protein
VSAATPSTSGAAGAHLIDAAAAHALRCELWAAMERCGLVPVPDYDDLRAEVGGWGQADLERLAPVLSRARDTPLLPSPPHLERILGFGRLLTAYVAEPTQLDDPEPVVRLGVLTNLIVTVYDAWLDSDGSAPAIHPRTLHRLGRGGPVTTVQRIRGRLGGGRAALLASLLASYDRHVRDLPLVRPERLAELRTALVRLHAAELATGAQPTVGQLRDKSALSIEVLGIPAWSCSHLPDRTRAAHGAWLRRLGRVIGWLDDVIDVRDDAAMGQRTLALRALSAPGSDASALCARIAAAARRVGDEWAQLAPSRPRARPVDETLGLLVQSWFGGVPPATLQPFPDG